MFGQIKNKSQIKSRKKNTFFDSLMEDEVEHYVRHHLFEKSSKSEIFFRNLRKVFLYGSISTASIALGIAGAKSEELLDEIKCYFAGINAKTRAEKLELRSALNESEATIDSLIKENEDINMHSQDIFSRVDSLSEAVEKLNSNLTELSRINTAPDNQPSTTSGRTENNPLTGSNRQSYSSNISPTVTYLARASGINYLIYVEKYSNMTYLYDVSTGTPKEVYSCRHIDGYGGPGPKQYPGDHKTIEEICEIRYIEFYNYSRRNPLYGSAAIGLKSNFGGIILCGTDIQERINAIKHSNDITNACPVYLNTDIEILARAISGHKNETRVIVEDRRRPIIRE